MAAQFRFTRKTWRKVRDNMKGDKGWPAWLQAQPATIDLFETMKPFLDDDVGKSWGIEPWLQSRLMFWKCPMLFFFVYGYDILTQDEATIEAKQSPGRKGPPSPVAGLGIDSDEDINRRPKKDWKQMEPLEWNPWNEFLKPLEWILVFKDKSAHQQRQEILKGLLGSVIEIVEEPCPGLALSWSFLSNVSDKERWTLTWKWFLAWGGIVDNSRDETAEATVPWHRPNRIKMQTQRVLSAQDLFVVSYLGGTPPCCQQRRRKSCAHSRAGFCEGCVKVRAVSKLCLWLKRFAGHAWYPWEWGHCYSSSCWFGPQPAHRWIYVFACIPKDKKTTSRDEAWGWGAQKEKKQSEPKPEKPKYIMKKHKRKNQSGGEIMVAAIHCNVTGKQVAQLSSACQPDCTNIVSKMVVRLNDGKQTLDDTISELNVLKGS